MRSNYEAALSAEFKEEGGYVDHPDDPGGATNMGITHKVLATERGVTPYWKLDKAEVKNLTREEAANIYRKNYWDLIKGDDLPSGVDMAVFDFAVNSGPARAAKALQRIVKAKVDGLIGPETLRLVDDLVEADVINLLCDDRLAFLQKLSTFAVFGKGWTARVKRIRNLALVMAAAPSAEPLPLPSPAQDEPTQPKTEAPAREAPTGFQIAWGKVGLWAAGIIAAVWLFTKFH